MGCMSAKRPVPLPTRAEHSRAATYATLQASVDSSRLQFPTVSIVYDLRERIRKATPMKIEIRNETAADVAAIEAVTISAFLHAPHTSHTEQFIVDALRKAGQLTVS